MPENREGSIGSFAPEEEPKPLQQTERTPALNLGETLIASTKEVFDTMVMMETTPEALPEGQAGSISASVTGTLGLAGDLRGILNLHFPDEVARDITASLLGMEIEELDDDVKDAIGEITNMVAGGIKTALAREGMDLELSIPTTVAGKSYQVNCFSGANRVIIPIAVPKGTFWAELKFMLNS